MRAFVKTEVLVLAAPVVLALVLLMLRQLRQTVRLAPAPAALGAMAVTLVLQAQLALLPLTLAVKWSTVLVVRAVQRAKRFGQCQVSLKRSTTLVQWQEQHPDDFG